MTRVELQDTGEVFDAPDGRTILDAALVAGLDYPYGCKSGTCGDCKTLLISGHIERKPSSPLALSDEECRAKLFLACKAIAKNNCVVLPCQRDGATERETVEGVISSIARPNATVIVISVRPNSPIGFRAGQFAILEVEGFASREYSFANPPGSPEFEFHIRRVRGGQISGHIYDHAKVGDRIQISAPFGSAYFRPELHGPVILVCPSSDKYGLFAA